MDDEKLTIKAKKYKEESVVASIRIPRDMLRDIDLVATESGRTRNEIIMKLLDFSLSHTEIVESK